MFPLQGRKPEAGPPVPGSVSDRAGADTRAPFHLPSSQKAERDPCVLLGDKAEILQGMFLVTRCGHVPERTGRNKARPSLCLQAVMASSPTLLVRKSSPSPASTHLPLRNPQFLLSTDILPKQETFPETDAKNWTKVTSITGLSFTTRGNVWGFSVRPALASTSGTITCGNGTMSAVALGWLLPQPTGHQIFRLGPK